MIFDHADFIESQTVRNVVNSRFGHGTPIYGPRQPDPRGEWTLDAIADFAALVQVVHRHDNEAFVELWLRGKRHSYCANVGSAVVIAAAALGMDAQTVNDMQEGLR